MIDSTNSCPLFVSRYSTLGGISLNACLSNIPALWRSLSLMASVLLLKPFNVFLNFMYLTGFVVQQSGIRISSVPLFVINFRSLAVSSISEIALYPSKSQFCSRNMRNPTLPLLVSIITVTLSDFSCQLK